MNLPPVPTDNLSKFQAIVGVLLYLALVIGTDLYRYSAKMRMIEESVASSERSMRLGMWALEDVTKTDQTSARTKYANEFQKHEAARLDTMTSSIKDSPLSSGLQPVGTVVAIILMWRGFSRWKHYHDLMQQQEFEKLFWEVHLLKQQFEKNAEKSLVNQNDHSTEPIGVGPGIVEQ